MSTSEQTQEPSKRKRGHRRDRARASSRGDGFSFIDDLIDLVGDLLTFWR